MKRFLLTVLLILGFLPSVLSQVSGDATGIIQKCIDLPELQSYYNRAKGTPPSQLYILQHGIEFPDNMAVSKFGSPVLLISKQGLQDYSPDVWLVFRDLAINGNNASVEFRVYYRYSSDPERHVIVNVELSKAGSAWNITKTKTEER